MYPFTFGTEPLAGSGKDRHARRAAEQGLDECGCRVHPLNVRNCRVR
jgi:hypothetical protein